MAKVCPIILDLTWYMKSRPWNLQAPYQVQVPASSLWIWAFKETLKPVLIVILPQTHLKGARPQGPSSATWGLRQGLEQGE